MRTLVGEEMSSRRLGTGTQKTTVEKRVPFAALEAGRIFQREKDGVRQGAPIGLNSVLQARTGRCCRIKRIPSNFRQKRR